MAHDASAESVRLDAQSMRTLLQALEACGHDALRFVDGGVAKVRALVHPRGTVEFDDYLRVVERIHARGPGELARVAEAFAALYPVPRVLAGFLLPARHFFRAWVEFALAAPWCDGEKRELADGAIEFELRLVRGWQPSLPFFEFGGLIFSAMPEVLNFRGTRVEVLDVTSTRVRMRVRPGRGNGLSLRLSDSQVSAIVSHLLGGAHPRHHLPSTRAAVPSVATLEARFTLTRAEARVTRRLAMGRSLKHIAKELDISPETARTHAKRAMQKTNTHRQAELVTVVLGCERD
jgi:DNA-binding CsgD family transcriptional regulator